MNYGGHYDRLIARARGRILEGYRERHHIIPRCMGGGNEPENIVALTAEEHYVAHQLLVRVFPEVITLAHAAAMMARRCSGNKAYGWLRRRVAAVNRAMNLGTKRSAETREKLAAAGRGRKHSKESRAKMSRAQKGRVVSIEHRAKLASANAGKKRGPHSAESRAKMSAAKMGHSVSVETRTKLAAARKGRRMDSLRGRTVSVDTRNKISESLRGRRHSSEVIARRAASVRAYYDRLRAEGAAS